jgi:hypothetical protein
MPKRPDIHSVLIMEGCLNRVLPGRVVTELGCRNSGLL